MNMTLLVRLLGAALCFVTVSSEVLPQADFNAQRMAGKWYLVGFATNAEWFVNHKDDMKMGTAMFTPNGNGDLDISYTSPNADGSCFRMNNLAKKADMPGRFTYASWDNQNDMRMVEVKYDEYALAHTIKSKAGEHTVVNKLYGRGADLSADQLGKFRQFSLETGVLPANIAILPNNGECSAA
ncbi:lipocalin isoform X1 [Xyrichtys novacula]|uniref:Lipocalin isoform X1 n=1 Tax=Xyrichtys novacula TaxID=13765 RepID=A0AAV1FS37_XYRNO|nr:lipocalin isoform X1 [Xyrichtys novacula]